MALPVVMFVPTWAAAQDASQNMINPPALLKAYLTAPKPGQSLFSASGGLQFESGLTNTRGWSLSGLVAHTWANHALAQFQVATNYASYGAASSGPYTTITDNQNAFFWYMHPVKTRYSWLGGAGWRRDTILALNYRWWGEGGAGVTLVNSPKVYAMVGGSFSGGRERRSYSGTDPVQDVGVIQILHWAPTKTASLEEWLRRKHDVRNLDDYSTTFYVAFMAHVTKHAGVKVSYQLDDEGLYPPSTSTSGRQVTVAVGAEVSFTRGTSRK